MKKRLRRKRAQAQIITVVLIILLVLAAIVVVWNVVKPLIAGTSEKISLEQLKVDLDIESAYIDGDNQTAYVEIERGVGKANLTALKFIFTDSSGKNYIYKYSVLGGIPNELETRLYNIPALMVRNQNPDFVDFSDIISVGIAFVVKTGDGEEITSNIKDVFGDDKKEDLRKDAGLMDESYIEVGKIIEIFDQHSVFTYNGHPSHYLYWELYVEQEIWYVDAETGEKIEQILSPASSGEGDYKIVKCQNDGNYTGCVIDTTEGCDGLAKDYGDIETSSDVYDDNYLDCESGNPRVGYFREPYNNGNYLRFYLRYLEMTSYGKHQVCVIYKHNNGLQTAPKCMEFITEWIDMDLVSGAGGNKNFGDTLSWEVNNVRTRYDNQPVLDNYLEKKCRIYVWDWWKDPRQNNGPSVTIRRHNSWDNYWGYMGVFFGISSSQPAGDRAITTEFKFPNSCYLRDRDGNSDYSFYHNTCGWYHSVNGQDKTVYCCGSWQDSDSGNCDKFVVSGQYGGTLTITDHIDASGDNYDDARIYMECPGGTAFGNTADPYTAIVSGADYFWVNDMDYSAEMSFSEALPDQEYAANTNDFTCNNLKLNFCGRARVYTELSDYREVYGNRYISPSSICVSGPECPHITC